MSVKPKIGIAFGGGGIRGLAHIGIMQSLEKAGIKADMVSGTSIGSAVAALYAAGNSADELAKILPKLDFKNIFKPKVSRKGFIDGAGYAEIIRLLTHNKRIEDLPIPLKIVTVDLVKAEKFVLESGPIALAVQASSAIPGVFLPVTYGDKMLVDGYVLDDCPDDVLAQAGADIIIAIDLDYKYQDGVPRNVIEIMNRTLDIMSSIQPISNAHIILRPITEPVGALEFSKAERCLEMGQREGENRVEEIKRLIQEWQPQPKKPRTKKQPKQTLR